MKDLRDNTVGDDTNLAEILYDYVKQWKWFVLSLVLCMSLAAIYILSSPKLYRVSSSILLNEAKNKTSTQEIDLESLGVLSSTNNLDNEIALLSSPDLMRKVVDSLNLQNTYFTDRGLRKVELFRDAPYQVSYTSESDVDLEKITLTIQKTSEGIDIKGEFLKGDKTSFDIKHHSSSLPTIVQLPHRLGLIAISKMIEREIDNEKYYVEIKDELVAAEKICSHLSIIPTTKNSSVLNLSLVGGNVEKGAAILYELISMYNQLNVEVNNEIAYSTSLFINERLEEINLELSDVEQEVVGYKQKNKITDLTAESQLFVEQSGKSEQKLIDIETQLNITSMINNFMNDPNNNLALLPNLEVEDPGLSQLITEYNRKLLSVEQLRKSMNEGAPSIMRLTEEVTTMRAEIKKSLQNTTKAYNIAKQNIQNQNYRTQFRIASVPMHEKGLLEKARLQRVKESLFLFLMQKREETSIAIASTANKARIIVSPSLRLNPISPKSKLIMIVAFIISLFIPIVCIYLRKLTTTQIMNRDDLEKLSDVNIIGQIGKNKSKNEIVISKDDTSPISEMFRFLRNKINFHFNDQYNKVIIVTSTMSNEGKTFVSINLALSYASLNKKVLLIGGDIRNPKLGKYLSIKEKKGLTDYLNGSQQWTDYLLKSPFNDNLDIMISGTMPPAPNELLTNPKLEQFICEAKNAYDIVLIDTAPIGLVSDAFLIGKYGDITLYLVREDVTPKAALNFINKQKEEKSLKNMYLVLNGSSLNDKYKYGYGKKYGYYSKSQDK